MMSLSLIKKYEKELLVLAMLWMSIRHMYLPINNKLIGFVFSNCGYGSIDMILFILGLSSYYELKKHNNYLGFVKDSLLKILPYTVIFFVFLFLIKKIIFEEFLTYLFGISIFYRSDLQYWLISLILLLFLVSPLYFELFKKKPYLVTLAFTFLVIVACGFLPEYRLVYIYFRIIIYLIGILFGHIESENKEFDKKISLFSFALMFIGWIFIYFLYHYYRNDIMHVMPFILIIPGLCILSSWIIDRINVTQKVLMFFSDYLVVYYLIHENIIKLFYDHYDELYINGIGFDWWINIFAFLTSILLSFIMTTIIDYLMKLLRSIYVNKFVK